VYVCCQQRSIIITNSRILVSATAARGGASYESSNRFHDDSHRCSAKMVTMTEPMMNESKGLVTIDQEVFDMEMFTDHELKKVPREQ
jgi:hypothetical protein